MSDCASSQPNQAKGYQCNGFAISECFRPFAERRVTRNLYMTGLGLDVTFTHIPELWPLVLDVVLFYCFLCLFDNHIITCWSQPRQGMLLNNRRPASFRPPARNRNQTSDQKVGSCKSLIRASDQTFRLNPAVTCRGVPR